MASSTTSTTTTSVSLDMTAPTVTVTQVQSTAIDSSDILVVPSASLHRQKTLKHPKNLSLILSVCGQALKKYGDQEICSMKILILLQHILTAVIKLTKLNEEDQKQLALDSIHWLIDNQKGLSDEEKNTLALLSETVFPQALELLSLAKTGCFSCLCKK
jgi:hypothetical protein